jgi:HAD superfamily hydrolase (TIGR01549 family)
LEAKAMTIKHFIFDLDGTLIDTERAVLKTWVQTLEEYNYHFSMEDVKVVLGVTTNIGLQRLNADIDESFMNRWQINYANYANEAEYFCGVEEMLKKLIDSGCIVGAVSSRCRKEYKDFFSRFIFDRYFQTVVLEEDTTKHKPNPEPLYKYLEITGARKEECIYIGDMNGDIECANNAGILSGLAKWNGSDVIYDEMKYIFHSVDEVLELIG